MIRRGASVEEHILLRRMAVEVTVEFNLAAFQSLPHQLLDGTYLGKYLGAGRRVLAVHVVEREAAPVVPDDHAIWIQHGDHLEDVLVSQHLGLVVIAQEKLDGALNHVRTVAFSGMNSRREDDTFALGQVILGTQKVTDEKHVQGVPSESLAQTGHSHGV